VHEELIAEVDLIRGNAVIISNKHLFHQAADYPETYPELAKLYENYSKSAGRQQLSKRINASGKYERGDSIHSSHGGSAAVWMVKK